MPRFTNNITTPTTEPIHFRQCTTCDVKRVHGYLNNGGMELPIPLSSIDAAKYLFKELRAVGKVVKIADEERVLREMRELGVPNSLDEEMELRQRKMIGDRVVRFALGLL